jgi:hypothetical protein
MSRRSPHGMPCREALENVQPHPTASPARRGTRTFRHGRLASTEQTIGALCTR